MKPISTQTNPRVYTGRPCCSCAYLSPTPSAGNCEGYNVIPRCTPFREFSTPWLRRKIWPRVQRVCALTTLNKVILANQCRYIIEASFLKCAPFATILPSLVILIKYLCEPQHHTKSKLPACGELCVPALWTGPRRCRKSVRGLDDAVPSGDTNIDSYADHHAMLCGSTKAALPAGTTSGRVKRRKWCICSQAPLCQKQQNGNIWTRNLQKSNNYKTSAS